MENRGLNARQESENSANERDGESERGRERGRERAGKAGKGSFARLVCPNMIYDPFATTKTKADKYKENKQQSFD